MTDLRNAGPGGLNLLSATEMSGELASGQATSEGVVRDCLARIEARDPEIEAWAFIDPELALGQAREADRLRAETGPIGPLHGIPVAVKDVLDTADMPTEYGSAIHKGHRPKEDCAIVAALRRAGAVILGKTRTTEFASPIPCGVKNPRDFGRSPGVSSSGSAAAVADYMVPLALGTQTGGSVILPAAFCGAAGYKASLDGLDRHGIRHLRPTLDTLGALARSPDDLAAFRAAVSGAAAANPPDAPPRVGLCRTLNWDEAQPESVEALEKTVKALADAGATITEAQWPDIFAGIEEAFRVISSVEGVRSMEAEHRDHADALNDWIRQGAEIGRTCSPTQYDEALAHAAACRAALAGLFNDVDFLITPSTAGEATDDLTGVSNSAFNRTWTLMHGPCVTLPAFTGPNGLPVGIQLVGTVGSDDALLAQARWVWERLA